MGTEFCYATFSVAFLIYTLTNLLIGWYSTTGRNSTTLNAPDVRNKYYQAVPDGSSILSGYTSGPRVLHDEEIYELSEAPGVDEEPYGDDTPVTRRP